MTASSSYVMLGAFRFLLAFMVFFAHSFELLGLKTQIANFGMLGVLLFFVVSGYVVSSAFHLYYSGRVWPFIVNRSIRLLPIYWVCYIATAGYLLLGPGNISHLTPNITTDGLTATGFLLALTIGGSILDGASLGPLSPAWSLAVEVTFYAIAAAATMVLARVPACARVVCGIVMALALYGLVVLTPGGEARIFGGLRFTPYFALGVAIHLFHVGKDRRVMLVCGALALACSLEQLPRFSSPTGSLDFGADMAVFGLSIGLMLLCLRLRPRRGWVPVDKFLGDLTYPFYLCHVPVLAVLWENGARAGWAAWTISVAVCCLVSVALHVAIEKPCARLRDRMRGCKLT